MKICGNENNLFILKEIGVRIKDVRLRQSKTQKELSHAAGVSYNTVLRVENGEGANIENLIRIMRALGLLQNFDLLIPEQELTPEEILHNVPKRKRAPKAKPAVENNWVWGDEKE